jgi:hypothetical protein
LFIYYIISIKNKDGNNSIEFRNIQTS